MYAANPFRSSTASNVSTMYRQVGVASAVDHASPHHLVTMLYDGLLEAIAEARSAIAQGDIEAKGRAIGRAVRIAEEGLRGGLDRQRGGELAQNLDALYQYIVQQLTKANLHSDTAALAECHHLVKPVRDAWVDIGSAQPRAA
jgi:flagellar protein FliS